jgi:hypothetical protein
MSNYNGRRGPNVSQYIRDLNTISPQDAPAREGFNMEEDLSLFTNTQFFDFDSGQNTDFQAQPVKVDGKASSNAAHPASATSEEVTPASVIGDMPNLDFIAGDMTSEYDFGLLFLHAHLQLASSPLVFLFLCTSFCAERWA